MVNDSQDVWTLLETDECSQYYGQDFRFDFSYMKAAQIKRVYKAYIRQCYQTQSKSVCRLYNEILGFKYFSALRSRKKSTVCVRFATMTSAILSYI
jgi:hypothetical protein